MTDAGRLPSTRAGMVPVHARTQVAELLQDALGSAAPVAALDLVASVPAVVLCIDDEPVAAAIGRETEGCFVIQAIAVAPPLRGLGLGRRLLEEIARLGGHRCIEAETDRDSVQFYRRCGFAITSLGEKFPGVERFRCRRALPEPRTGPPSGDTP